MSTQQYLPVRIWPGVPAFPASPVSFCSPLRRSAGRHRMIAMKHLAKLGVLFLILLIGGAPLVAACTLPSAALTPDERACCRQMASQCGGGQMPSSHSCCKSVVPLDQRALAKSPTQLVYQAQFLYLATVDLNHLPQSTSLPFPAIGHSPPEAHPSSPHILRI